MAEREGREARELGIVARLLREREIEQSRSKDLV
jgi:hypothetical protein